MAEIIPAIMPKNFEDLKGKIAIVKNYVSTIQLDLMDGKFVKGITWPFKDEDTRSLDDILNERAGLPFWQEVSFEFDLMVSNARENFDNFLRLGPKRIIFHIEAEGDEKEFMEFLEAIDLNLREYTEIGVAINTTTPTDKLDRLVSYVDFVQCMGIEHIGLQGEPFDERVFNNIKYLRDKYPDLIISVDGGVNFETAPRLIEAGASRLVIGSAIWTSVDIRETIEDLKNL
jgi:ribulose-phosphate 3-epimerase